jgi:hypothetical protein
MRTAPGDGRSSEPATKDRPEARAAIRQAGPRIGPFESERAAAAAARHIYGLPPGTGAWGAAAHKMLEDACAGIDLGAYDHAIILWLAGWEPSTVAVIAGLITRARQAGGDGRGVPS